MSRSRPKLGTGTVGVIIAIAATVLGLQYAIAQTEETASSTPAVEAEVVAEEPATTTEEVVAATTEEDSAAPAAAPDVTLPDQAAIAAQEALIAAKDAAMTEITGLQEAYFKKEGKYLQVLKGNGLPDYETGKVSEKLGKDVSDKAWVHVYEAPGGKGYQVMYEDAGVLYSVGYGPEAAERTFERRTVALPSATSTEAVIQ